jgi:uncharacterized protein (UPF0335 family)
MSSVYAEAKGQGFDTRAIREVVRLRKQDRQERDERRSLVEEYLSALGDFASTELGAAAISRASQMMLPM